MKQIGLLSDTHSFLDPKIFKYFKDCDEIWHAGDIGSMDVLSDLIRFKSLRAVFGNIDGTEIRMNSSEIQLFEIEKFKVLMIHIAGPFSKYKPELRNELKLHKPDILICGHSHILKIANDPVYHTLYINPGACGKSGFHKVRTIVRFTLDNKNIRNMEVIELHND